MVWRARDGAIDGVRLPDFVGIGAPRAGTTWLHYNLAAHPQLCLPADRKEQRFWNHNLSLGIDRYAAAFDCTASQVMGEISPTYSTMDPWRMHLMARMMPDVRILYMLRNPIDRTWSHLSLWAKQQGFEAAALAEEQIRTALQSEEFARASAYTAVYDRYCRLFSRDQIWVGFYDDIEADPRQLLASVFVHLGVASDVAWEDFPLSERINTGLLDEESDSTSAALMPERWRSFLARHFATELAHSAEVFGGHAARWLAEAADV